MAPLRKKTGGGTNGATTTTTAVASNAALKQIVLPHPGWVLGNQLGQGAQGSVYAVVDRATHRDTAWAVKVTAKPPTNRSKTGKAVELRVNASSLNNEGLLYKAHLKPLRGTVVPNTPNEVQGVHESGGYLLLFMERMECDLIHKVEQTAIDHSEIPRIGPLAVRLVELVQAIHTVKQLVIDVKPENFMFASSSSHKTTRTTSSATLPTERLRMVDFGLMRAFQRPEQLGELQGTALYASLHMHTFHNTSRRDDLEMILYVIGEILIRCQAIVDSTRPRYESTAIPSYLPWSQAPSDEALYQIKQEQVQNPSSDFYRRMPREAAQTLFSCLQQVWAYKFNTKPDYDGLKAMLQSLSVPNQPRRAVAIGDRKQPPAAVAATAARKTARTTSTSTAAVAVVDDEPSRVSAVAAASSPNRNNGVRRSARNVPSSSPTAKAAPTMARTTTPRSASSTTTARTIGTQTSPDPPTVAAAAAVPNRRRKATYQPLESTTHHHTKNRRTTTANDDSDCEVMDMEIDEVFSDPGDETHRRRGAGDNDDDEVVAIDIDDDDDDDDNRENELENIPNHNNNNNNHLRLKITVETAGNRNVVCHLDSTGVLLVGGTQPPSQKESDQGTVWIQLPPDDGGKNENVCSCRLVPVVKRERIVHVLVKYLSGGGKNSSSAIFYGRKDVTRKLPVPKGKEAVCMIPGQVYVGTNTILQLRRL